MKPILPLRLSIRQRLPLLICILLLSVMLVFGSIAYLGVHKAALNSGEDRLKVLSGQLSSMLSLQLRNMVTGTYNIVNKPAMKDHVLSNGRDSVKEALSLLELVRSRDTNSVYVEVRTADHRPLLKSAKDNTQMDINIAPLLSTLSPVKPDSGVTGKLYAVNNRIYYPVAVSITDQEKLIGYVVRWRQMLATPRAMEQLYQLLGTECKFFIGNADGTLWTDMITTVPPPVADEEQVMTTVLPVANTDWKLNVQLSKQSMLQPAHNFMYWLIAAGLTILAIGILVAWLLSRNISKPLIDLTEAASGIAAGNYSQLVQMERRDELGQLAHAFNAMAMQVQQKLRMEAELAQHKIMQQHLVAETAIQAQEKERETLGNELHDNINQILASAKLYLEVARTGNEEMLPLAISKSYENVNLAIGEIRQLSKQLVPPSLDNTLLSAISDLAEEIRSITGITVTVHAERFNEDLVSEEIKLTLYRIVQEQVNNILKHAAASDIMITIETEHDNAYLVITDNGVGFDTRKRSKGIGLRNIDSRIRFLDGTASVISQTGKGCRLKISVPLYKQNEFAI
jgi:signal transduction histidine kinase